MTAASDFLENALLDHVFDNTPYTSPTTVYLALFTAAPSDAGGGTEVSGNGYAREAISFGTASGGSISNDVAIDTFTASGGNWGNITHFGIFDAVTAGNLLVHGAWNTARTINDGEKFTVAIGDLTISLD